MKKSLLLVVFLVVALCMAQAVAFAAEGGVDWGAGTIRAQGFGLPMAGATAAQAKLTARDAARLLPARDQFVRVWRFLEREAAGGLSGPELPLLRRLAAEMTGAEGFLRAAVCLAVFAERGLLSMEREGDVLTLRLTAEGKKVELDDSPLVARLHRTLQGTER